MIFGFGKPLALQLMTWFDPSLNFPSSGSSIHVTGAMVEGLSMESSSTMVKLPSISSLAVKESEPAEFDAEQE